MIETCPWCGAAISPDDERCPKCSFRHRPRPLPEAKKSRGKGYLFQSFDEPFDDRLQRLHDLIRLRTACPRCGSYERSQALGFRGHGFRGVDTMMLTCSYCVHIEHFDVNHLEHFAGTKFTPYFETLEREALAEAKAADEESQ